MCYQRGVAPTGSWPRGRNATAWLLVCLVAACDGGSSGGEGEGRPPALSAPWGSGAGQLGKTAPDEGAPEAPKSFTAGGDGTLYVLDQVNARIQVFAAKGAWLRSVALPPRPFEDLELWGEGFVLADLHHTPALVFLDAQGQPKKEVALAGPDLPEPGRVTALESRSSGYWVQVDDEYAVHVADPQGEPVEREVAAGLALPGGDVLRSEVGSGRLALARTPATGGPATRWELGGFALPAREQSLLALLPDGRLAVAVIGEGEQTEPETPPAESHELVLLDASGAELSRRELPVPGGPEDVFRRVRVGGDGNVYVLTLLGEQAQLVKVTP